jgi:predicted ArsR family transcriptional regulator
MLVTNTDKHSIKQEILELLKNSDGLTISEVSRKLSISYTTASKYLAVLLAEGKVKVRELGMAKLFKVSENYEKKN